MDIASNILTINSPSWKMNDKLLEAFNEADNDTKSQMFHSVMLSKLRRNTVQNNERSGL